MKEKKKRKKLDEVRAELEENFMRLQQDVERLKKEGRFELKTIGNRMKHHIRKLRQLLKETT